MKTIEVLYDKTEDGKFQARVWGDPNAVEGNSADEAIGRLVREKIYLAGESPCTLKISSPLEQPTVVLTVTSIVNALRGIGACWEETEDLLEDANNVDDLLADSRAPRWAYKLLRHGKDLSPEVKSVALREAASTPKGAYHVRTRFEGLTSEAKIDTAKRACQDAHWAYRLRLVAQDLSPEEKTLAEAKVCDIPGTAFVLWSECPDLDLEARARLEASFLKSPSLAMQAIRYRRSRLSPETLILAMTSACETAVDATEVRLMVRDMPPEIKAKAEAKACELRHTACRLWDYCRTDLLPETIEKLKAMGIATT